MADLIVWFPRLFETEPYKGAAMKPSETKVAGHKLNRKTAPLKGRSLVSPPGALQRAAGHAWPITLEPPRFPVITFKKPQDYRDEYEFDLLCVTAATRTALRRGHASPRPDQTRAPQRSAVSD